MVWGSYNFAYDGQGETSESIFGQKEIDLRGFTNDTSKHVCEKEREVTEKDESDDTFKVPGRTFIIEPAFLMVYLFHIGSFSVTSQYIYYAIGEKYNLSAWMAAAADGSEGNNGSGSGVCGSGNENQNSTAYRLQQSAQAETARFNFYMDLVTDIPGLIVILFFGTLIDKFGRKPGMIIPLIGVILRSLIYVFQMVFHLPVEILFLTGLIEALSGGMVTFFSSSYAYYADTIPPARRARRIAIADIVYGLSLAALRFLVGIIIDMYGFLVPFFIFIPGHCLNLIYIIFFIPESRKTGAKKKSMSPRYIYQSFKVVTKKRPNNRRKILLIFIAAWVTMMSSFGAMRLETIYKLNSPFCWTASMMGAVSSLSAVITNLTQIFAALVLIKPLGETTVVMIALLSNMGDQIVTGMATTSWMLFVAPVIGCMSGMQMPLLRAIQSQIVDKSELGALSSSLGAFDKVFGMVTSSFFNFVYAETLYVFKGTVFMIAAVLLLASTILIGIYKFVLEREKRLTDAEGALQIKAVEEEKDVKF